jgi:hypothetical protein
MNIDALILDPSLVIGKIEFTADNRDVFVLFG